jgi:hypothetical protein
MFLGGAGGSGSGGDDLRKSLGSYGQVTLSRPIARSP